MKKLIVFITFTWLPLFILAQEPLWKNSLENKAKWIKVMSTGTIITSTNGGLLGFDPKEQKEIWKIKGSGEIKTEDFNEIEGTSFAMYESFNPGKSLQTQTNVIDYITGRVIYNNIEADVKVLNNTPLLDIGALLLEVKKKKMVYLSFVDIASGKEQWKMELPDRKTGIGLGALKQSLKQLFTASPIADYAGNILFPDNKILKRIDAKTGKVLWASENKKRVGRLNLSDDGKMVYMGAGKKVMAINLEDGKNAWTEPLKISGEFKLFIPSRDQKMYVVTTTQINFVEEKTGKPVWKKPVYFDLPFITLQFLSKGILVLGGDDKSSMFNYIGFDGKPVWKKAYKTDKPVVDFKLLTQGILFTNEEEANMINLQTGADKIWKKRIKLKGTPVTYVGKDVALIYADKKLYEVKLSDITYRLVAEDIKFKGMGEDVRQIEIIDEGYLLHSQQNIWLITPEGKVVYSKYYPAPSFGGLAGKILGTLGQVYATVDNLETTQDPSKPNTVNIQRSKRGDELVHGIKDMIANRKETFLTKDAIYMMTRVDDGDKKYVGMVKLAKNNGEEKGKIVLKSLNPIYEMDYISGQLFVIVNDAVSGAVLYCYKL